MTDLKIIDELIILMKKPDQSWVEFENSYNITQEAMDRLRNAYLSGEMEHITASLAIYFANHECLKWGREMIDKMEEDNVDRSDMLVIIERLAVEIGLL